MSSDPKEVAAWMFDQLRKHGELYQEDAVYEIARRFGPEFTYENENGNPAIKRDVLNEFRRISEELVVWSRSERLWRWRERFDPSGSRQTD